MGAWKNGILGCFSNPGLSMIICSVAPLAIAKNSEYVGEAAPVAWIFSVSGCPCVAGALLRGMIRNKHVSFFLSLMKPGFCSKVAKIHFETKKDLFCCPLRFNIDVLKKYQFNYIL